MSLRSRLGTVRRLVLCSFYKRLATLGDRGPIVSFTFDDFPRTALTMGAAVLEKFGLRGTYYVAGGLMGTTNNLGEQFSGDDLSQLARRGHEIASHTFSHVSARQVSLQTFVQEVEKGKQSLLGKGATLCTNFAYPYGDVTLAAKEIVGRSMSSCRGTCGGVNGPEVDLNLLRANGLYGTLDNLENAKQLVITNEKQKTWLVFYSHDVCSHPSPFGCTPELLAAVVECVVATKARVLTVAEVMAELQESPNTVRTDGIASS